MTRKFGLLLGSLCFMLLALCSVLCCVRFTVWCGGVVPRVAVSCVHVGGWVGEEAREVEGCPPVCQENCVELSCHSGGSQLR